MSRSSSLHRLALPILCVAALTGCGGSDDPAPRGETTPRPAPAPPPGVTGPQRTPLDLPPGIPLRAAGDAPAGTERALRAWTAAVREADFDAAARLFARRARVQNGTPVLILQDRQAARSFNASFPCGARVIGARGTARGYAIIRFVLTERRRGDCGSGTGAEAGAVVRVRDGRIAEWYRLPDPATLPPADTQET